MKMFNHFKLAILLFLLSVCLCSAQEQNKDNYKEGYNRYKLEDFRGAVPELEKYVNANQKTTGLLIGSKIDFVYQIIAASSFYYCDFEKSEANSKIMLKRASGEMLKYGSYYNLGQMAFTQNNLPLALDYFNKAVSATTKNGDALVFRGICHLEMGNIDAAQKDFNGVLNGKNSDMLKARALYLSGDTINGMNRLMAVIKSDPSVFNYLFLASVYGKSGKNDLAIQNLEIAFKKGLKNYPVYIFYDRNLEKVRTTEAFKALLDQYGPKDVYSKPAEEAAPKKEEVPAVMAVQAPPQHPSTVMEISDTTAILILSADGYSSKIWLLPTNQSPEYNLKTFGLSTFHPVTAYQLTELSDHTLLSIAPSAFIRSVKEDMLFTSDYVTSGLKLSAIPELSDVFAKLKSRDELIIASKRDSLITSLIALKKRYAEANNRFVNTEYEISGTCTAYKSDYNVNTEEINLHVSLNFQGLRNGQIYLATVKTPLPLNDAINFFDNNEKYVTKVKFRIFPGLTRKGLGIAGGGVSAWSVPNLVILQNPVFHLENPKGFNFDVMALDLKGMIWPDHVNYKRWDLNRFDKPDGNNMRLTNGVRIK